MVLIVGGADRARFRELVAEMHRQRKRVFIDRLGWDLPATDGEFEIDQFDVAAAVYLMALGSSGELIGSLRLLPSTGPHILGDLFPQLCHGDPPRGHGIWEISRFCTSPTLRTPWNARRRLLVGMIEYALLHEVSRYTCVTHMVGWHQLLGVGLDAKPLGDPHMQAGELIGALALDVTPSTLKSVRDRAGFAAPLLRWELPDAA